MKVCIIVGYILGMAIAYGIVRTKIMEEDDLVDTGLSVCVGLLWPGFLVLFIIGGILAGIFWIIGKLLDFPVQAVKNLIIMIKEKHDGST